MNQGKVYQCKLCGKPFLTEQGATQHQSYFCRVMIGEREQQKKDEVEKEQVLEMVKDLQRKGLRFSGVAKAHGIHEHFFMVEFMDYSEIFSFFSYEEKPSNQWIIEKENFLLAIFGRAAKVIYHHSSK